MRKSTLLLSIAALAGASASAALWIELRAERDLNDELSARLQNVRDAPVAPAVEPAPPASPHVEPATPLPRSIPTRASTDPLATAPARAGRMTGEEWMARQRQLLADPRYREAWYEQQRLQMVSRRERLKTVLGLSDEQAAALIDINIDRQMSWQFQTPTNDMTEEYMRGYRERMEAARLAEQTRLREVLGDAKYAKYEEYLESSASRQQVDRLRNELSGADALRDDQVEPLIAAMHAEQAQMMKEMQAYTETLGATAEQPASMQKMAERQTEQLKAANTRIRNAAGAILSFSQLEQLDAMLKRDVARHEAQIRMQRIQSKLENAPEPPGNAN